jgi:hypothetical protein
MLAAVAAVLFVGHAVRDGLQWADLFDLALAAWALHFAVDLPIRRRP